MLPVNPASVWLLLVIALPVASLAADPLAECEAEYAAAPGGWNACGCFYKAGIEGLQAEAAGRLEAHLAEDPGNPCLSFNLGRLRLIAGDDTAGPLLRAAAEGYVREGEPEAEVLARINHGRFLSARGLDEAALEELATARRVAAEAGDRMLGAQVQLDEARLMLGGAEDLERVSRLLLEVEAVAFPDGPGWLRRDTLQALGNTHYLLGRYGEAETYFQRMVEVTRESGDPYGEATAMHSRVVARLAGRPRGGPQTVTLLREVLEVAMAAGQQQVEAYIRWRLGKFLPGEQGDQELRSSVRLARQIGARDVLAQALGAVAVRHLPLDPEAAGRLVDEALAVGLETPSSVSGIYGWSDRMQVVWAIRPRAEALAEGLAMLSLIERLRDLQRAEGGRASLFAVWAEVYYALAGRLLDPTADARAAAAPDLEAPDFKTSAIEAPDVEQAFAILERLRARVLLESLQAARIDPQAAVDEASANERKRLLGRFVEINRRLLDPRLDRAARAAALSELDDLELEEAELRDRMARAVSPGSGAAFQAADFAALAEARAALGEDEALLAFQLAPWEDIYGGFAGGSWLLAITRQGSRVYRLPAREDLEPVLKVFQHLFPRRNGSEALPAREIAADLLSPALADLPAGIERLVIVPDGALHRMPFAALRTADGSPLAARFQLSIVPSATLWLRWREALTEPRSRSLVLADPLPAGAGADGAVELADDTERNWQLARGVRLAALPHARKEGRTVARYLGRSSELLLGEAASERALKTAGAEPIGLLHFAAHAVVDGEHPHRSAVVLSPGSPAEDGLLQPREIARLNLAGSVVVLSTCQSAAGAVLAGEGPLSLARAFFQAGARTVVGSLWPLRDDEAAALFAAFYRHLGRGVSVAGALAAAQAERIAAGEPAAAWAGVSVFGNGDVVPLPGGVESAGSAAWGWTVAVALLVAVAWRVACGRKFGWRRR